MLTVSLLKRILIEQGGDFILIRDNHPAGRLVRVILSEVVLIILIDIDFPERRAGCVFRHGQRMIGVSNYKGTINTEAHVNITSKILANSYITFKIVIYTPYAPS